MQCTAPRDGCPLTLTCAADMQTFASGRRRTRRSGTRGSHASSARARPQPPGWRVFLLCSLLCLLRLPCLCCTCRACSRLSRSGLGSAPVCQCVCASTRRTDTEVWRWGCCSVRPMLDAKLKLVAAKNAGLRAEVSPPTYPPPHILPGAELSGYFSLPPSSSVNVVVCRFRF